MAKIILTVGPPGCGKTLWAKLYVEDHIAKRLNRDDFRLMMQNGEYSSKDEKVIKRIRNYAIESWLEQGYDVIVDDLNLTEDVFPKMVEIANRVGNVSVEEHVFQIESQICWYNNTHRTDWQKGCNQLDWNKWWLKYSSFKKHETYYAPPKQIAMQMFYDEFKITKLPKAIIIDLDNTLAMHPEGRDPFNHDHIPNDILNTPLANMMSILALHSIKSIIVTGRGEAGKESTLDWLFDNKVIFEKLFMRPASKSNEKDYIIKKEIYEKKIKDIYFVLGVFEDREQTTESWKALGLPVYQTLFGRY